MAIAEIRVGGPGRCTLPFILALRTSYLLKSFIFCNIVYLNVRIELFKKFQKVGILVKRCFQTKKKNLFFLCPRDDSQGALRFAPACLSVCVSVSVHLSVHHALWYRVCVINSSHSF